MTSLFDRLGGTAGITRLAGDLVDLHIANPRIAPRFLDLERDELVNGAATFMITGTGGPAVYEGEDMHATHRGMNIGPAEFMAVLDDALQALGKNGVAQREQEEVLFILYSMRAEVMHV